LLKDQIAQMHAFSQVTFLVSSLPVAILNYNQENLYTETVPSLSSQRSLNVNKIAVLGCLGPLLVDSVSVLHLNVVKQR